MRGMLIFFVIFIFVFYGYKYYSLNTNFNETEVIVWEYPSQTDSIITGRYLLEKGEVGSFQPRKTWYFDENGKRQYGFRPFTVYPECGKSVNVSSNDWPSSYPLRGCSFKGRINWPKTGQVYFTPI